MKQLKVVSLCLISMLLIYNVKAKDIKDIEFKFSIVVPDHWTSNIYREGTDKVCEFMSPDNNAFIQLRSFKADPAITLNLVVQIFEESYLPQGSNRIDLSKKNSVNGIPGIVGNYTANVNNLDVGISVFYAIQNGQGYALMYIIPVSMFDQKEEEVKRILHSFVIPGYTVQEPINNTIVNKSNSVGSPQGIKSNRSVLIENTRMGDELGKPHELLNTTSVFNPETRNVYIVFDWKRESEHIPYLKIAWYYDQKGYLIDEVIYDFKNNSLSGTSHAFLSKPNNGWPEGKYTVEFSIAGQLLKEVPFEVKAARIEFQNTTPTNIPVQDQINPAKEEAPAFIDPYTISEQIKFWADVPISSAKWVQIPFQSSLMIKSMSSNRMSYQVSASGGRNSTAYAPHIIEFSESTKKYAEKNTYNFKYNNYNYYVDDADDIFSLAYNFNWICGRKGMIMFSDNGGSSWTTQETPTEENINSISFANEFIGCAVGDKGTILITKNSGQNWAKISSPVNGHLKSVVMTDKSNGYILVEKTTYLKGFVLKTTDGGTTWNITEFPSQFQSEIEMTEMSFVDTNNGWICGKFGLVFHTANGGKTWEYQESARDATANSKLNAIYMINLREGWACGEKGTLLHTINGGQNWTKIDIGVINHFTALEFNGPYMGWLSTDGNVYQYYDKRYDTYMGNFYRIFTEKRNTNE